VKLNKTSLTVITALVATGFLLTTTTIGLLSVTEEVAMEGTITTLNVDLFLDSQGTQNCTAMSWGGVYAGESSSKTMYVKNTGDVPVTLSMIITNWNPDSADDHISMTWNRENTTLDPEEIIQATLTLTISEDSNGISNFSYKMLITGIA